MTDDEAVNRRIVAFVRENRRRIGHDQRYETTSAMWMHAARTFQRPIKEIRRIWDEGKGKA